MADSRLRRVLSCGCEDSLVTAQTEVFVVSWYGIRNAQSTNRKRFRLRFGLRCELALLSSIVPRHDARSFAVLGMAMGMAYALASRY